MKLLLKSLALVAFLALVFWAVLTETPGAEARAAGDPAGDGSWRHAALWDDGKAEFCAYEVDWARYGDRYPGRALLILVKEPWAPDLDVKADRPRPDGFDVLKLNHVRDVPTGIYTYHQMASVYLRRADAGIEKIAASSAEACGVSSAQMRDGRLATHSYFDGVGDRSREWPAGAWPADGLPALLRDHVAGEAPETLEVFPTLMDSRLDRLEPVTHRLARRRAGVVEVPAGSFPAVEITLTPLPDAAAGGAGAQSFLFEEAAPHRLLALEREDGTTYRLAKCERIAYWQMQDPSFRSWYPDGLTATADAGSEGGA